MEAILSNSQAELRKLPSIDQLLKDKVLQTAAQQYGTALSTQAARFVVEQIRENLLHTGTAIPSRAALVTEIVKQLETWTNPSIRPLINATGVVLHTNLGRAPLSQAAINAMQAVAVGYSNLEYDLEKGQRGSRYIHTEALLQRLTGAEAALVVNNNASALLLILTALARRRRVLIARTQMIEIGGGFRIPEVMKQSGAILEEIGTTNKVHLADYQKALQDLPIGLVLRAHQSNFKIVGFATEPEPAEIAALAHEFGVAFIDDLGSGTLIDTAPFGLEHEPTVQEALAAGADLVCFSGDKLLGGPQAGIIVGKSALLKKLKQHPMARAIRADKLALAGLSATLIHYLKDEATREVPIWQMISQSPESLGQRAAQWQSQLGQGQILAGQSTVGGGSLPGEMLPTSLLALSVQKPERFLHKLRMQPKPIIARIQDDRVVLDPRTVLPSQEPALLDSLQKVLAEP